MVQLRIYVNFRKAIRRLSYEEKGMLFDAMLAYAEDKTLLPLEGKADAIWDFVQELLDAQHSAYENKCAGAEKARIRKNPLIDIDINANQSESTQDNLSYLKKQIQIKEQIKDKEKKRVSGNKFRAPSLEEVKAYCSERGNKVNAEQFVSFYESKGWKVGTSGMKDWKAAVRTWEQRDQQPKRKSDFAERTVTDDDFKDLFLPL